MQDPNTSAEDVQLIGYIYGLFAADQPIYLWECRYIGKTRQTLKEWLWRHESEVASGKLTKRCNWFRSVLTRGSHVEMRVLETHVAPDKVALDAILMPREKAWIAEGRRQGWRLTNGTDGGEGVVGDELTEENRRNISKGRQGRVTKDETRAKLSAASKGRTHPPETRAKLSEINKGNQNALGRVWTPEQRA